MLSPCLRSSAKVSAVDMKHIMRNALYPKWKYPKLIQKNEPDTKRHNSYSRAENKKSEPDY